MTALVTFGGRCATDGHTHAVFIDMRLVHSFEEAVYNGTLSELIDRMRDENSVPTEPFLSQRCGSNDLSD